MGAPFVGRRRELGAASDLLRRAIEDRAPAVGLITGDPGTGKSRLLAEIVARSRPARPVRVVGFEPLQRVPLAAVGELLRFLAKAPDDGPLLEGLVFGSQARRDPLRIFEAAHRAMAGVGPFLLAVDDLQWLDEQSLALLLYLVRSAESARQPMVVIAAARPSAAAWSIRASVDAILPTDRRAGLELGPLVLEDGLELVRAIDAEMADVAGEELWRRASGSPFWLDALARGGGRGDPSSILGARLRALTGDAGTLLAALAVAARPLPPEDAATVLGWEGARARHAVRELVDRGLALEAPGDVRLTHDLIREAVLGDLPKSVRQRAHARLAAWLEAIAGDDLKLLQEALEHRAAAGQRTADLALRLVTSPHRRLLGGDGRRLIASISDALEPGTSEQMDIDRGLGELSAVLGDQEQALASWTRLAARAADPSERRHAYTEAARAAYRLRRADTAHPLLDRARAAQPGSVESAIALDALEAEVELWLDHRTSDGNRTAQRALAAANRMAADAGGLDKLTPEARRASLAAHESAFDGALQEERPEDTLRLSEACVLVAGGLEEESYLTALIRPAFGLRPLGLARGTEDRCRRAWNLARELILPTVMVEAGHVLGRALRDLGRLAEARTITIETAELESRLGYPPRRWGNAPSILHGIDLALGDHTALDELRRDAEAEPDPHYRLAVHQAIAAWQARLQGRLQASDVAAELAAARAASALAGCPRCSRELSVVGAELLARIGQVDEAARELAAWEAAGTSDYLMRRVWRSRARVAIALASGEDQVALTLLGPLVDELQGAGLLEDLLWARLDMGRALATIDRGRSVQAYTEAAVLAERIGAVPAGRLATQALRRLGVRAWRRGRAAGGDGLSVLSAREREVARLVAGGDSNREIAESLLVSPKTVERHLTNTLAKLGLRNRTELAALVRGSPDD